MKSSSRGWMRCAVVALVVLVALPAMGDLSYIAAPHIAAPPGLVWEASWPMSSYRLVDTRNGTTILTCQEDPSVWQVDGAALEGADNLVVTFHPYGPAAWYVGPLTSAPGRSTAGPR